MEGDDVYTYDEEKTAFRLLAGAILRDGQELGKALILKEMYGQFSERMQKFPLTAGLSGEIFCIARFRAAVDE